MINDNGITREMTEEETKEYNKKIEPSVGYIESEEKIEEEVKEIDRNNTK